jgi:hypothetical protein
MNRIGTIGPLAMAALLGADERAMAASENNGEDTLDPVLCELKRHVEHMHGGSARLVRCVPIKETFRGGTVWEGIVYVFDLEGHSKATRAYAWSSPVKGSTKRHFVVVLHVPPIASPTDAVRAAVVAEDRRAAWS